MSPSALEDVRVPFWRRLAMGIQIYARDLGRLLAVVLVIWLPGNYLLNYLLLHVFGNPGLIGEFILGSLFLAFLFPIEIAAVLMILDGRRTGFVPSLGRALLRGLSRWPRVFLAEQVAGIYILLGLVLLIVPGVRFALRYSLVGAAASLEGHWPFEAMTRSAELTSGLRLQILGTFLVFYSAQMALSFPISILVVTLGWNQTPWGTLTSDCIDSVISSVGVAYVYLFYLEGRKRVELAADSEKEVEAKA